MKQTILFSIMIILTLSSCQEEEVKADAYGNFESTSTIVSSQSSGPLLMFSVEEGQKIPSGKLVGLVDTTNLDLQRKLLVARMGTLRKKTSDPNPEIAVLEKQKKNLVREQSRIENLLRSNAATSKQLDDINGQIDLVNQQIRAAKDKAGNLNRGIMAERDPLQAQLALIEKQIADCYIYNPISGVVLDKLREASEIVGPGMPLYAIANLDTMELRAYTDAVTLQDIHLGDVVDVRIDQGEDYFLKYEGRVTWISEEAEFTPKTIQTKEERINLVYAFKVAVPNEGILKQGMPGEVWIKNKPSQDNNQ